MNLLQRIGIRLALLPIRDYRGIEGWLSPREALALYRAARRLGPGAVAVEIGSWKGKSTYCLARGLAGGTVVAIDPFDASGEPGSREVYEGSRGEQPLETQFRDRMKRLGVLDRIDVRKGASRDFAGAFPRIDFLFIDGDHSIEGCLYDYEAYAPAIGPGGWLAIHDYDPPRKDLGPTWVIENRVVPSGLFEQGERIDSLWLARKK